MEVQEGPGYCREGSQIHGIGLLARRSESNLEERMSIFRIGEVSFELPVVESLEKLSFLRMGLSFEELPEA